MPLRNHPPNNTRREAVATGTARLWLVPHHDKPVTPYAGSVRDSPGQTSCSGRCGPDTSGRDHVNRPRPNRHTLLRTCGYEPGIRRVGQKWPGDQFGDGGGGRRSSPCCTGSAPQYLHFVREFMAFCKISNRYAGWGGPHSSTVFGLG
jgi:hypothetical protein